MAVGRVAAVAVGAAAVAERSRIETTELASGVRVITERMPEARSACVGVWVGVGARDEPEALSGVSHFLEHLLFKGSDTRTARDIAQAIDRVGGDMNVFTAKEYTAYVTRLPSRHLDLGIDVLADVLSAPSLRDGDIEAERQVILEELMMDEDTPDDRAHTLVFEALFPGHPLGRETAGSADTVSAIAPDEIRTFFEARYGPSAFVVAAAGDVHHEHVVAEVEAKMSSNRAVADVERTPPVEPSRRLSVLKRPIEQAHLALGFRTFGRLDPDREALEVLNHVLGGGMSSRLLQTIREDRGLAYSVFSAHTEFCDAGALDDLRRDDTGPRRRRARPRRRRARAPAIRRDHRRTSSRSRSAISRAHWCSAWRTRAAAWRGWADRSPSAGTCARSKSSSRRIRR